MPVDILVGTQWGDEGKGKLIDVLTRDVDMVIRFQGGNNAGHTVINDKGKFILNLLPSGILRPEVVNVMGNGMVVDIKVDMAITSAFTSLAFSTNFCNGTSLPKSYIS